MSEAAASAPSAPIENKDHGRIHWCKEHSIGTVALAATVLAVALLGATIAVLAATGQLGAVAQFANYAWQMPTVKIGMLVGAGVVAAGLTTLVGMMIFKSCKGKGTDTPPHSSNSTSTSSSSTSGTPHVGHQPKPLPSTPVRPSSTTTPSVPPPVLGRGQQQTSSTSALASQEQQSETVTPPAPTRKVAETPATVTPPAPARKVAETPATVTPPAHQAMRAPTPPPFEDSEKEPKAAAAVAAGRSQDFGPPTKPVPSPSTRVAQAQQANVDRPLPTPPEKKKKEDPEVGQKEKQVLPPPPTGEKKGPANLENEPASTTETTSVDQPQQRAVPVEEQAPPPSVHEGGNTRSSSSAAPVERVAEQEDDTGSFPIHDAIQKNNFAQLEALLDRDSSSINKHDNMEEAPIHLAALFGRVDMMRLLVKKGAKIEEQNKLLKTAVHYAVMGECAQISVPVLQELEADLYAPNKLGRTPLHQAVYMANVDAVTALRNAGVIDKVKDKRGRLAVEVARFAIAEESKKQAILKALRGEVAAVATSESEGEEEVEGAESQSAEGQASGSESDFGTAALFE